MAKSSKRSSLAPGVNDAYMKYVNWVEETDKTALYVRWGIMLLVAAVLVGVAEVLDLGDYVSAGVSIPASLLLFLLGLGIAHKQHLERGTVTIKEKYSPRQRMGRAGLGVVLLFVVVLFSSDYIPYALGGVLFLTVLLALANMVRMTPLESTMSRNGIVDPRDRASKESAEPEDVIDEESFSWEDEDEEVVYGASVEPGDPSLSVIQSIDPIEVRSLVTDALRACELRNLPLPMVYAPKIGGAELEWITPTGAVVIQVDWSGEAVASVVDASGEATHQEEFGMLRTSQVLAFVTKYGNNGDSSGRRRAQ